MDEYLSLKEQFIQDFELEDADCGAVIYMIVFVRLPSGALEMIVNNNEIYSKFNYYKESYDDDLKLYANPNVSIERWMFVGG